MKKIFLMVIAAVMIIFASCVKNLDKYGFSDTTVLKGRVIEETEHTPLAGVNVSITNGSRTYASYTTGSDGLFEMEINFNEIDKDYYLALNGPGYITTYELKGMGMALYDYKDISLTSKCTVIFDLFDTYGDGWNGAYLGISDGSTTYQLTINDGNVANYTYDFATGTIISVILSGGGYNTECSYRIYYMSGDIIHERVPGTVTNGPQCTFTVDCGNGSVTTGTPTVTTTSPTWSGSTVTTGGNVTKDGGETVTARGVCYGTQPYPDITGQHTTNGSGTGPYSSTFTISQTNVTYYIRAYATNSNGTSYGEQKTIIKLNLPTFQYAGSTYYVAPDPGTTMNHYNAVAYCENYGIYGTTGWTLPTIGELTEMYAQRNSIGGFAAEYYHSSTMSNSSYNYYVIHFSTGNSASTSSQPSCRVRPIKKID